LTAGIPGAAGRRPYARLPRLRAGSRGEAVSRADGRGGEREARTGTRAGQPFRECRVPHANRRNQLTSKAAGEA
jgi:hypothetical protein